MNPIESSASLYRRIVLSSRPICVSLFLLLIRVIFGWAFFQAGKGKLGNIDRPIAFFQQLHIPMPVFNAWLVAIVETFGGLLLLAGLGARLVCIALVINMVVAYLTADFEKVSTLFAKGDVATFASGAPFWFLVTSFIVLAIGPGWFSIDALLKRFVFSDPIDPRDLPRSLAR